MKKRGATDSSNHRTFRSTSFPYCDADLEDLGMCFELYGILASDELSEERFSVMTTFTRHVTTPLATSFPTDS